MLQEIIYTSAPHGLRVGSSGFCTVAATKDMRPRMIQLLEFLSSYRHVGPAGQNSDSTNPVVHAHLHVALGNEKYHLLSRIADAGLDYSRRSNLIAHHVALPATNITNENPASVLQQSGLFRTSWKGDSKWLEPRELPRASRHVKGICKHWQAVTGDAGWGGVLAAAAAKDRKKPAYIVFKPGNPVLELIEESLSLLPSAVQWQISFSTYFTKLPSETTCLWRCVLEGSPEADDARRSGSLLIDLCDTLPAPPPSIWSDSARSGHPPNQKAQSATAPDSHRTVSSSRQGHLPPSVPTSVLQTEPQSRAAASSTVPPVAVPPKLPEIATPTRSTAWSKILIPAAVFAIFIAIGTSAGLVMSWRSDREEKTAAIERRVDALKTQVDNLNRAKRDLEKASKEMTFWKSSIDNLQATTNEVNNWVTANIAQRNGFKSLPDEGSAADDPSKIEESINRLEVLKEGSHKDFERAANEFGVGNDQVLPEAGFVLPEVERLSSEHAEDRKHVEALLSEIKRLCGPFDEEAGTRQSTNKGEIGILVNEVFEEIDHSAETLRHDDRLKWAKDLVIELERVCEPPNLDDPLRLQKLLANIDTTANQVSNTAHEALTNLRDEHRGLTDLLDKKLSSLSKFADSGRSMGAFADSPFASLGVGILDEIHLVPSTPFGEDWVAPTEIARILLDPQLLVLGLTEVTGFKLQPQAAVKPVAEDSEETFGIWPLDIEGEGEVGRFELRDDILSFRWDEGSKRAATNSRRKIANRLPTGLLSLTYQPTEGASVTSLLPLHSVPNTHALEVRQDAKTPPGRTFVLPYKDRKLKMKLVSRDTLPPGWKVFSGEDREIVVELDLSPLLAQTNTLNSVSQVPDKRFRFSTMRNIVSANSLPALPQQKATLSCVIRLTEPKELPKDTGLSRFEYQIQASTHVRGANNSAHVRWEDFLIQLKKTASAFISKKEWIGKPKVKEHLEKQAKVRQDRLTDFIGNEVLQFNVHVVRVVTVNDKQYEVPAYLMGN